MMTEIADASFTDAALRAELPGAPGQLQGVNGTENWARVAE